MPARAFAGPSSTPGDVVEVAFRSWTAGPVGGRGDPPFFRLDYAGGQSTHPVVYNEVVVESPRDRPIYVDVVNGKAGPSRREGRRADARRAPRLGQAGQRAGRAARAAPERDHPDARRSRRSRTGTTFRSWYGEAVRGFTEPDAQVRELAAKLTQGKTTRDAKLRALFDFVADDIRYVNYVSGEWWLPNRPQQLLARREGDCDDKALLLITLLKAVGIDAQEVMVQTRLTGQPSVLRARGAADPALRSRHRVLARARAAGHTSTRRALSRGSGRCRRWTRAPSRSASTVPPRSSTCLRARPTTTASTPRGRSGSSPTAARTSKARSAHTGDDAFWMRTYLTEPGPRAQWVEEHLVGAVVSHGGGRQEGRLQGRSRARRRDDALARALERPRAAREGKSSSYRCRHRRRPRRSSRRS